MSERDDWQASSSSASPPSHFMNLPPSSAPRPHKCLTLGVHADQTALGYLIGPTIGSALFSLTHPSVSRGKPAPLEVMDRAFYDHIKANRASPEFQSVNNPAPDFYGEKVRSLPKDWMAGPCPEDRLKVESILADHDADCLAPNVPSLAPRSSCLHAQSDARCARPVVKQESTGRRPAGDSRSPGADAAAHEHSCTQNNQNVDLMHMHHEHYASSYTISYVLDTSEYCS